MEEFRKKKLSRVVFLVKLNENSDPTLRDRRGAGNGKFRPVFFSFFFFFLLIGVFPRATRIRIVPFRHCLCVQTSKGDGFLRVNERWRFLTGKKKKKGGGAR